MLSGKIHYRKLDLSKHPNI